MLTKKISVVLLTVIACLVILEIGLRAVGRRPTTTADGIYEQDGDSFRLKKNMAKVIRYPAFTYTIYTNGLGFRDKSRGPKELQGRPFDVFLGASDVFGNGVEYEESFVGILAGEAGKKGREVLNLATGGHYFLDQEDLLRRFMADTRLKPSRVFYCINALHIPKFDQRNRHIIVKGGYPMDLDGWRVTYLRLLAGNGSSAFCFFRDGIRRIQERYLGYEINSKSPEFLEVFSKANSIRSPERIKAFEKHLDDFEAFCRQNGIDLAYVYLPLSDSFRLNDILKQIGKNPDDYDTSFYEKLVLAYCARGNRELVNLNPVLQEQYSAGREIRFKLDPHFNIFANRVIGEFLAKAIL